MHEQVTLWNFLKYNMAGGGDSSLYGVESGTFYLRNALTNLNLVTPLALLVPASALFLMSQKRGEPPTLTCWLPLRACTSRAMSPSDVNCTAAASSESLHQNHQRAIY